MEVVTAARTWGWAGCLLLLLLTTLLHPPSAAGQQSDSTVDRGRLRVFIDCTVEGCDQDFFTTELPFVAWVRNPAAAEVSVLVTAQTTGASGTAYTLTFRNSQAGAPRLDTVVRTVPPGTSDDAHRQALARTLSLSLTPYLLRTGLADRVRVVLDDRRVGPASSSAAAPPTRDPWNSWVFQVGGSANMNAEQRTRSVSLGGSFSAQRVTERWKTALEFDNQYSESRFELSDGTREVFPQWSYSFSGRAVRALSDHWSAGVSTSVARSDYRNERMDLTTGPAMEYNLFPWAQATHRQLIISYTAGTEYTRYAEETIYLKTRESLPFHQLTVAAVIRQPWGSVNGQLRVWQPLQALARHNVTSSLNTNLHLTGQLGLSLSGSVESIRYQPYIARGTLTDAEILAGQRAQSTSYRVWSAVGLTYTFGSIFNAVVNPRLEN